MMEHDLILQDLDSLWFFSNVLSPPSPSTRSKATSITELEKPKQSSTEPKSMLTPTKAPLKNPPLHAAADPSEEAEEQAAKEAKTRSEASGWTMRYFVEQKGEQSSKRSQGMKRTQRLAKEEEETKELVEAWLEGGFESGSRCFTVTWEKRNDRRLYEWRSVAFSGCNMPSLNDDLAMKQHLRTWAHAVACAVR